jgi:hypothetical protein
MVSSRAESMAIASFRTRNGGWISRCWCTPRASQRKPEYISEFECATFACRDLGPVSVSIATPCVLQETSRLSTRKIGLNRERSHCEPHRCIWYTGHQSRSIPSHRTIRLPIVTVNRKLILGNSRWKPCSVLLAVGNTPRATAHATSWCQINSTLCGRVT